MVQAKLHNVMIKHVDLSGQKPQMGILISE